MIVDPALHDLVIAHTTIDDSESGRIVMEYAVIDALNIISVESVVFSFAPMDVETVATPTLAAGQRMKVLKLFVTSFSNPLAVSFFLREVTGGLTAGNFGRASLGAGEIVVYNEGAFTIYDADGDVRVPA